MNKASPKKPHASAIVIVLGLVIGFSSWYIFSLLGTTPVAVQSVNSSVPSSHAMPLSSVNKLNDDSTKLPVTPEVKEFSNRFCIPESAKNQKRDAQTETLRQFNAVGQLKRDLSAALAKSSQPLDQALSSYLAVNAASGYGPAYFVDHPECAVDFSCAGPYFLSQRDEKNRNLLALVHQASTTNDGAVYALAYSACNPLIGLPEKNGCAQITAEKWASLSPDRVEPYIAMAKNAIQKKDQISIFLAMDKIVHVKGSISNQEAEDMVLDTAAFNSLTEEQQAALKVQLFAFSSLNSVLPLLDGVCSENMDSNRRMLCAQLGERLHNGSARLSERVLGAAMMEFSNADVNDERIRGQILARLKNSTEVNLFNRLKQRSSEADRGPMSCRSLREYASAADLIRKYGEVEAAKKLLGE